MEFEELPVLLGHRMDPIELFLIPDRGDLLTVAPYLGGQLAAGGGDQGLQSGDLSGIGRSIRVQLCGDTVVRDLSPDDPRRRLQMVHSDALGVEAGELAVQPSHDPLSLGDVRVVEDPVNSPREIYVERSPNASSPDSC